MVMRLKGTLPLKHWQRRLCNKARMQLIPLAFVWGVFCGVVFWFVFFFATLALYVSFCPEVNTQDKFWSCSSNCVWIILVVPNEADLISLVTLSYLRANFITVIRSNRDDSMWSEFPFPSFQRMASKPSSCKRHFLLQQEVQPPKLFWPLAGCICLFLIHSPFPTPNMFHCS